LLKTARAWVVVVVVVVVVGFVVGGVGGDKRRRRETTAQENTGQDKTNKETRARRDYYHLFRRLGRRQASRDYW